MRLDNLAFKLRLTFEAQHLERTVRDVNQAQSKFHALFHQWADNMPEAEVQKMTKWVGDRMPLLGRNITMPPGELAQKDGMLVGVREVQQKILERRGR